MGKGDQKTRRGKLFAGSYGKKRPRKKKSGETITAAEKPKAAPKPKAETKPKAEAKPKAETKPKTEAKAKVYLNDRLVFTKSDGSFDGSTKLNEGEETPPPPTL